MTDPGETGVTSADGTSVAWVLLIERGLDEGSDLALFWHEGDAISAPRDHLAASSPPENLLTAAEVRDAIETVNQMVGNAEYIVLAPFPVVGFGRPELGSA
ncbi:hypothetical protein BH23ACT2_BH23ACT2_08420 [soil metagenome]